MSTLKETRRRLVSTLRAAGIDFNEVEREADLILQHATGWTKARQMAAPEVEVSAKALAIIQEIGERRLERVPLQYLLGEQWFMGLPFKVRPGVLIPRADTETLVEVGLRFLQRLPSPVFADIGTGSGAIAVSLLKSLPAARAYAIDISEEALAVAAENAREHGVADRLTLVHADWTQFSPMHPLDAILSNPPYVPVSAAVELQPEVAVFEPKQAIFGSDEDGLGFYRGLSRDAARHIRDGGLIAVEVGKGQDEPVAALFRDTGWKEVRVHLDLSRIGRCISAIHALEAIENSP